MLIVITQQIVGSGADLILELGYINGDVTRFALFRQRVGIRCLVQVVVGLQLSLGGIDLLGDFISIDDRVLQFDLGVLLHKLALHVFGGYLGACGHRALQLAQQQLGLKLLLVLLYGRHALALHELGILFVTDILPFGEEHRSELFM